MLPSFRPGLCGYMDRTPPADSTSLNLYIWTFYNFSTRFVATYLCISDLLVILQRIPSYDSSVFLTPRQQRAFGQHDERTYSFVMSLKLVKLWLLGRWSQQHFWENNGKCKQSTSTYNYWYNYEWLSIYLSTKLGIPQTPFVRNMLHHCPHCI